GRDGPKDGPARRPVPLVLLLLRSLQRVAIPAPGGDDLLGGEIPEVGGGRCRRGPGRPDQERRRGAGAGPAGGGVPSAGRGPTVGASVFALVRYRPSCSVYLWGGLLIPFSFVFADRPLMSMPRFVLPLFPAFWALAELTERWRIPQKAVAAVGAAGLGLLVVLSVNWYYIF